YAKRHIWNPPRLVKFFAGGYYAEAFQLMLPYDVLSLATEQGGLVPYRVGGGQQSESLRVHDSQGRDWSIRSTTKVTNPVLPHPFYQIDLVNQVFEYVFSATQPEAALSMPFLCEAAGVLHLKPRLFFLPDQAELGPYRGFISDEVVLLEQRPSDM